MSARGSSSSDFLERFQAKACSGRSASAFTRVFDALVSAFTRVFDALVSAFTRVFDALWGGAPQARTQNRENNPMQSRIGPDSKNSCCGTSGAREKNGPPSRPQPDLIPL